MPNLSLKSSDSFPSVLLVLEYRRYPSEVGARVGSHTDPNEDFNGLRQFMGNDSFKSLAPTHRHVQQRMVQYSH